MLKNHLKIAFRNLLQQKGYSFINITGFAIGITCCILIMLYVQDELSYDRYNINADRIYRVITKGRVGGNDLNMAVSCAPLAFTLVQDFPEVVQATRLRNYGFPVLRYEDRVFSEEDFWIADSTFFEVFTVPFIAGDPATALARPNNVVLTESAAKKYFGDQNPLGKTLNADNRRDWIVTGVIADVPATSHLDYDFLGSASTYPDTRNQIWLSNNFYTYVLLRENASRAEVEAKMPGIVEKYVGPQVAQVLGASFEELKKQGASYGLFLQPLTEIHLHSDLDYEAKPNGSATYVTIFTLVAIGILLIACVNFMNLATARSANRAKEVGIRKTLGSNRHQLIRQFLAEAIFTTTLSIGVALLFVQLLLPSFNQVSGKELDLFAVSGWYLLPLLAGVAVVVGFLAGFYPALFLAAFQPVKVLKGNLSKDRKSGGHSLRSLMVVFQFVISIGLLIGTLVVRDQLSYVQNKRLGFNTEQVVIVEKTDDIGRDIPTFIEELQRNPNILAASNSNTLPGKFFSGNVHQLPGGHSQDNYILFEMRSDYDFAKTYEIEMADGRFFSKEWGTDSSAILINETAVQMFGFDDPLGKEIVGFGRGGLNEKYTVVGVLKDLHFESLHQKIRPMAIKLFRQQQFGRYVGVRINPENAMQTLSYIEETWHKFAGAQAFEHVFFNDDFAELYKAEVTTDRLMKLFSALAILIACLGLFGLASFIAEQRTKEIGIRKVLGASTGTIVFLLSRQFTKWVLLATILAWPLAYYAMNSWLQNFAYRTALEMMNFVLAAAAAILVALLAVGHQTIKAALANPIDSLRYE